MENKELTAEWARKRATSVIGVAIKAEIAKCNDAIEKAVAKNEMSVNVFIHPDELTIADLNRRGFKTKYTESDFRDPRESSYLTISW
jgi:hypothetical protein